MAKEWIPWAQSIYLFFNLSIDLSIDQSIDQSIGQSIDLYINLSICRSLQYLTLTITHMDGQRMGFLDPRVLTTVELELIRLQNI